jgi:dTDP-4-dehydrorhamnose reductase
VAALSAPRPVQGLFHVAAAGTASWYEVACRVLAFAGSKTPVVPIRTSEYPTLAVRPAYSVLDSSPFGQASGFRIGPWDERLALCLQERAAGPST